MPPPTSPSDALNGGVGDDEAEFPWASLVSRFVHPVQVAVIEAIRCVGVPVSPSEMQRMFGGQYSTGDVAYHARALADRGILRMVDTEQVRGATRHYYVIAKESEWR